MLTIRRAGDRGHTALDWLDSYHTFSFGGYQDERHSGFRSLRVLNDDRLAAGKGFGAHGHRNMEIITYVLSGAVAHRDSTGTGERVGADEVQLMTAGSGVIHSEFNASETDPVHLLQIWIVPAVEDLQPAYRQIRIAPSDKRGRLRLVAGPKNEVNGGALAIQQDARMYAAVIGPAERVTHTLAPGRGAWLHCATGRISVNELPLSAGDGVAVADESSLLIEGVERGGSELLLFDLA